MRWLILVAALAAGCAKAEVAAEGPPPKLEAMTAAIVQDGEHPHALAVPITLSEEPQGMDKMAGVTAGAKVLVMGDITPEGDETRRVIVAVRREDLWMSEPCPGTTALGTMMRGLLRPAR